MSNQHQLDSSRDTSIDCCCADMSGRTFFKILGAFQCLLILNPLCIVTIILYFRWLCRDTKETRRGILAIQKFNFVFFLIMFIAWGPITASTLDPFGNMEIIVGGVFFCFFMVPAHAFFIRAASQYYDAAL